jgi:hypothetical protein
VANFDDFFDALPASLLAVALVTSTACEPASRALSLAVVTADDR